MVRLLLDIVVWITAAGFTTFCVLFVFFTAPWRDRMGKHILIFMSSIALAVLYGLIGRWIDPDLRMFGWLIVMTSVGTIIWLTVALLIKYQLEARKNQVGGP